MIIGVLGLMTWQLGRSCVQLSRQLTQANNNEHGSC